MLDHFQRISTLHSAGLLLPTYFVQTCGTVVPLLDNWNVRAELVPRNLFPESWCPLTFLVFSKGKVRKIIGLCLYYQAVDVTNVTKRAKEVLINGRPCRSVWRALCEETLRFLGGEASLPEIYRAIEERPTPNPFWKEKVRQTLQRYFTPVDGKGRWRIQEQSV
jgi:hypothetical protein